MCNQTNRSYHQSCNRKRLNKVTQRSSLLACYQRDARKHRNHRKSEVGLLLLLLQNKGT